MKGTLTIITIAAIVIISACSSSKKATTTPTPAPISNNTSENNILFVKKPMSGIFVPGNEELTAIQTMYSDATLDKLKEGHSIYVGGACTGCHPAKSIYQRETTKWKGIIDDMAQRSKLTDAQKDAVYKYVLAIKATQPK